MEWRFCSPKVLFYTTIFNDLMFKVVWRCFFKGLQGALGIQSGFPGQGFKICLRRIIRVV